MFANTAKKDNHAYYYDNGHGSGIEKGMTAVQNLTDQSLLADIAINARNWEIKLAAIEKINEEDQPLLAYIAKNDGNTSGRVENVAAQKLTDQTLLLEVAKNAKCYEARISAIEKLDKEHPQDVFADIAKTDSDIFACNIALGKLTDQVLLADVAQNARYQSIQEDAAKNLRS